MTAAPPDALPPSPVPVNLQGLDLRALARSAQPIAGQLPVTDLSRLLADVQRGESPLPDVHWSARAEWRQPVPGAVSATERGQQMWLQLQLQAEVDLECQRCLSVCRLPVVVDRWFRFVADEATALAEDDGSEEDLLVWAPRFDLLTLIEDELLLALPLVPMHPVCPQPLNPAASAPTTAVVEDERPHPFAALGQWRRT